MPKMKSKSAAKKRFKLTASGLIKAKGAGKQHFMRRRSQDMIRTSRGMKLLSAPDQKLAQTYFKG